MTSETKILLFDIENAPNLSYTWGKWEQNVIEFKNEWYLLSFAYKWLGEKKVHSYSLPDFKLYKRDKENDRDLAKKLWDLMSRADIIVGHNSVDFDERKANARFIYHGLTPPKPYKSVDTLKVARKHFFFNSNKLGDLAKHLGLGEKEESGGFETWRGCMLGDKSAWKQMVKYNKKDIVILEKVYNKLLPWIGNHPNVNVLDEILNSCPNCGSHRIQSRGFSFTAVSKRKRFQCQSCGKWSVGKTIKTGIEIR